MIDVDKFSIRMTVNCHLSYWWTLPMTILKEDVSLGPRISQVKTPVLCQTGSHNPVGGSGFNVIPVGRYSRTTVQHGCHMVVTGENICTIDTSLICYQLLLYRFFSTNCIFNCWLSIGCPCVWCLDVGPLSSIIMTLATWTRPPGTLMVCLNTENTTFTSLDTNNSFTVEW